MDGLKEHFVQERGKHALAHIGGEVDDSLDAVCIGYADAEARKCFYLVGSNHDWELPSSCESTYPGWTADTTLYARADWTFTSLNS